MKKDLTEVVAHPALYDHVFKLMAFICICTFLASMTMHLCDIEKELRQIRIEIIQHK